MRKTRRIAFAESLESRVFLSTARLALISDYGTLQQSEADVADLVNAWNAQAPLDAIVTSGDNDQSLGNDYDNRVGQYYHEFIYGYTGAYGAGSATQRFLPAIGNHDWGSGLTPYLDFFTIPGSSSGTERYYNYTIGPVEFFVLDSDTHEPDGTSSTSVQAQWLQNAMAQSTAPWQIISFHHTAYSSSGSHGSSTWMRWPFQEWGADLVVMGHNHVYERVNVNGLRYVTNGVGGYDSLNSFGTPIAGSEVRYNAENGAMLVEVTDTSLSYQFVNTRGEVIDTYSTTNVPMPKVSVTATDAAADEGTGDVGAFTFTRSDVLTGDITVRYTLGGTATNGSDYQSLSGSVLIPDGTTSVVVDLIPINDSEGEGDESAVLTMLSDPAYVIGAGSATVVIADDDLRTATFQQGVGGYLGTVDTQLSQANPSSNYATSTELNVDGDEPPGTNNDVQALLRFEDIFGGDPGRIPAGATITSATLELQITNPGSSVNVHRMLRSWSATDTWSGWGAGVQPDGAEAAVTADVSTGTIGATGKLSINVTASLVAWLTDPGANLGWVLLPTGTDGVDFYSSEGATPPRLLVMYAPAGMPVATGDGYSVAEDGALNVAAPGVLGNDSDPDGDALTAVLLSNAANGAVTLNADGSFSYLPNADFAGDDSFTYKAYDGSNYSDPATVRITVTPVNDAPVAVADAYSMAQDTTLSVIAPGVLGNDGDVDGDALTAAVASLPLNGALSLSADGAFTYTPAAGFIGTDSFAYIAVDSSDAESAPAVVTITVNRTNDAPVANDDAFATAEDSALIGLDFVANDTDADGDRLAVKSIVGPSHGSLTFSDGAYTYTPDPDFNGMDSFSYTVTDGQADSNTATVTITVSPVNDAPVAGDDSASVVEGSALQGASVLANDGDVEGEALTAVLVSGPASGALALNADGTYAYTPAAGFIGTDSFTYIAVDSVGAASAAATVTITVLPLGTDDYAISESTTFGTASGLADAAGSDDVYETVQEEVYGKTKHRLSHTWEFNVAGGTQVTFYLEAHHNSAVESFTFDYSPDGVVWTTMLTLIKTSDDNADQTFDLPAATSGRIWVRVVDTSSVDRSADTVYVDHMFIRSFSTTPLPVVSLAASDADAAEPGANPGQFTITRTGDTSAELVVDYSVGGTATNAVDYVALAGQVTIPAGSTSVTFSVNPIDDPDVEGDETIILGLLPSSAYTIGAASATVTIADDDVVLTAPAAPSALSATATSSSQIELSWADNAGNEDGFAIERSTDGVNFAPLASVAANATSCLDTGLNASSTYYYRVRAYNAAGNSDYSNTASATTQAAPSGPVAPSNLVGAITQKNKVKLAWQDNSLDETGFNVYISADGVNFTPLASVAARNNSGGTVQYTTAALGQGAWYFRVSAFNASDESEFSNIVAVII